VECDGLLQEPGSAARRRYRGQFFVSVLNLPQVRKLLSGEHFSVDGTLIEAWASMKSFCAEGRRRSAIGKRSW